MEFWFYPPHFTLLTVSVQDNNVLFGHPAQRGKRALSWLSTLLGEQELKRVVNKKTECIMIMAESKINYGICAHTLIFWRVNVTEQGNYL